MLQRALTLFLLSISVQDPGALGLDGAVGGQFGRGGPAEDDVSCAPLEALSGPRVDGHGEPHDSTDGEEDEDDLQDPTQPFDFDHAVNYVTTIKKRFAGDPDTYKAFLDVLHTYQRQREHNGGR